MSAFTENLNEKLTPALLGLVLKGLGLGRIGRTVVRPDDECIRGMVAKVTHLVAVEKVEG